MRISGFFFAFFVILKMLSCYLSTAQRIQSYFNSTANTSTTWTTDYNLYNSQPLLLRETNVADFICVACCRYYEYEENCTSNYIFAIFISGTKGRTWDVVWSANRGYSVRWKHSLDHQHRRKISCWHEPGNLVLFDDQNSVVWQSFDHPTDCWLPGQKLFEGQKLKSSVSLTDSTDQEDLVWENRSQPEESWHLLRVFQTCWEKETLLDMVDVNSEDMQINGTEVVETMKIVSWCLQTDYTRRPSMSPVVKVLEGGMNIESNLDYNFTDPRLPKNNSQEKDLTPLLPSVLSGPRFTEHAFLTGACTNIENLEFSTHLCPPMAEKLPCSTFKCHESSLVALNYLSGKEALGPDSIPVMRISSFFFAFFVIVMLSCYSPTAQLYHTANLSTTWTNDYSHVRPMLLRQTKVALFACGFYCDGDCTSYIFAIYFYPTVYSVGNSIDYRVVWSANRDHPVGDNAILNFTAAGELVLKDADGSIVWTTNTAGKSVAGMNLTDTGNLVLFDDQNSVVWQSFDHPTDCLLPGQKLFEGQKLKSNVSLTNSSEGMYYLQVTEKGLFAYVESNPPQAYFSLLVYGYNVRRYIRLLDGSMTFFIHSSKTDPDYVMYIPQSSSAQYMKLMPDGHLQVFKRKSEQWTVLEDLTKGFVEEDCSYPLVCGRNSICSTNQQCSCPGKEYFRPVNDRQPNLGCSEITPLTCNSTQDQDFITLDNVTYFTSIADMKGVNMETCKLACLNNCSCKAAFFKYYYKNASYGECYLPSEIFTMKNDDSHYVSLAFIKVQKVTSHRLSHRVARVIGSTIGSFMLLLVVAIGFITYVVHNRKRDDETEEDYLDQHETLLDMVDVNSEDMQVHNTEVVEMMKMASWCLQIDYTRRPAMSSVVKVLEGGMPVESNLDYNFTDPRLQKNNSQEKDLTPLLPSILSGPR
ncbi:hypothetical protein L1987_61559 [Smallanthus sonchifolius]|uniref:Uncharacterized protein n=1 Tax=Smallanthus sonchifolius TaxID=185202 RepID=A0ACB9C827_9ASTR|nr:hypothetical protein L1987_61559 [Smallanthus sonchifolius]